MSELDLTLGGTFGETGNPLQVKEQVYRRLVRAVIDRELEPGTQLKERQLAEKLGVSKTPVREAFVRMEKEGLVEVTPYRGAVVRGYSLRDIREIFELRELLEGFCAARAATRLSDVDQIDLRSNVRRSRECLDQRRRSELPDLFDEFDRLLYRQSSGHRIGPMLNELDIHLRRLGYLTVRVAGRLDLSVQQHEQILFEILKRDPHAAERVCRDHIRSVYADLVHELPLSWGGMPAISSEED